MKWMDLDFFPIGHIRSERVAKRSGFQLDPRYTPKADTDFVLKRYI